jgi:hypothetical protein
MRTAAFRLGDKDVDAIHIDVLIRRSRRRCLAGWPHDDAIAPTDDRRLGRALPHVPDVAVRPHARLADAAGLGGKPLELLVPEVEPVELPSPAVVVRDEERSRVRVPVGGDLAGKIDRELLIPAGRRVEDERALQPLSLVEDDEALITGDRRPAGRLEAFAGPIPQLGDLLPVEIEDAESAIPAVAVLAVCDREEPLVARDADDSGALRMRVDKLRRGAVSDEIDRRPLVAARSADDLE